MSRLSIPLLGLLPLLLALVASADEPSSDTLAPDRPSCPVPALNEVPPDIAARRDAERRIRGILAGKLDVTADEMPLTEFVQLLKEKLQIEIGIHRAALAEEGIDPAKPAVTIDAKGLTARTVLDTVLRDNGLDWLIHGEVLRITTGIQAEEILETRVYDVSGLVATANSPEAKTGGPQALALVIEQSTEGPWESIDGTGGTTAPFQTNNLAALVIRQTRRNHEAIETLLADLRALHYSKNVHARQAEPAKKEKSELLLP